VLVDVVVVASSLGRLVQNCEEVHTDL